MRWIIYALLAAALAAIFAPTSTPYRRGEGLSHMRRLASAAIQYVADNDDHLPLRVNWMEATAPYVNWTAAYHASGVRMGYGIAFRARLGQAKFSTIADPAQTVEFFDSVLLNIDASSELWSLPDPGRHGSGNDYVTFVDGHVRSLSPEAARNCK